MPPVYSYLCHSCNYEFDNIESVDSPSVKHCTRCEEKGSARRVPSHPSTPRGNFSTATRRSSDKTSKFNFDENGQGERPGILSKEGR